MLSDMIEVFTFDAVLPVDATQNQIYSQVLLEMVDQIKYGKSMAFICYGSHRSGKTYTLLGSSEHPSTIGLLPRAARHAIQS